MYQKETSGLPKSQLHVGTPKDILKLIERIESAAEELRWNWASEKIGSDFLSVLKLQVNLPLEWLKNIMTLCGLGAKLLLIYFFTSTEICFYLRQKKNYLTNCRRF